MAWIFWINVFLIIYTFVGYPVILVVINRLRRVMPLPEMDYFPDVEVILVVRNVAQIIEDKIASLQAIDYPPEKFSILIISDQSQDDTVAKINALNQTNIRCVDNHHKSSKSACLNQAIALSRAELLFLTDARQKHQAQSLKSMVRYFADETVGAVSGELVLLNPQTNEFAEGMDAYWRYEKFIRLQESRLDSVPGVTGAVYVMRRAYFEAIPDDTLLDDVLIPMKMIFKGKSVRFEPDAIATDIPSDDVKREKIRKTRTLAGNWQLLAFEPGLLNPFKNRIWWQFVSHKVLRLISPFCLILIFISSLLLADKNLFFYFVLLAQLIGYSLIFLANYFPLLMKVKLIKMGHSFMILMWFTWLGFWSFATRQHLTIWK